MLFCYLRINSLSFEGARFLEASELRIIKSPHWRMGYGRRRYWHEVTFLGSQSPCPVASPGKGAAGVPAEPETGPVTELPCHAAVGVVRHSGQIQVHWSILWSPTWPSTLWAKGHPLPKESPDPVHEREKRAHFSL